MRLLHLFQITHIHPPNFSLYVPGIVVELSEVLGVGEDTANGEYETIVFASVINRNYGGVDPIDYDCSVAGKCIALLTRVSVVLRET